MTHGRGITPTNTPWAACLHTAGIAGHADRQSASHFLPSPRFQKRNKCGGCNTRGEEHTKLSKGQWGGYFAIAAAADLKKWRMSPVEAPEGRGRP